MTFQAHCLGGHLIGSDSTGQLWRFCLQLRGTSTPSLRATERCDIFRDRIRSRWRWRNRPIAWVPTSAKLEIQLDVQPHRDHMPDIAQRARRAAPSVLLNGSKELPVRYRRSDPANRCAARFASSPAREPESPVHGAAGWRLKEGCSLLDVTWTHGERSPTSWQRWITLAVALTWRIPNQVDGAMAAAVRVVPARSGLQHRPA